MNKAIFVGKIDPNDNKLSIIDFKKKYKIHLKHLRIENPKEFFSLPVHFLATDSTTISEVKEIGIVTTKSIESYTILNEKNWCLSYDKLMKIIKKLKRIFMKKLKKNYFLKVKKELLFFIFLKRIVI